MRVVSLLPSATEIVFALGRGDDVVGVTFECDYPADVWTRRIVSTSALPEGLSPAEIDRVVSERIASGEDLYRLDADALRDLRADVILTQDLCAVCAVDVERVDDALAYLGCQAEVVTLDPRSLADVLDSITHVGGVLGADERAAAVVDNARQRLAGLAHRLGGATRRPTLLLEWTDPPFSAGHWVPDLVTTGGGDALLSNPAKDSARLDWDAVAGCEADVVVVAPCGYHLAAASEIAEATVAHGHLPPRAEVWAVDADAFFVRPGPRVIDGAEIMSRILHPEACGEVSPDHAVRVGVIGPFTRVGGGALLQAQPDLWWATKDVFNPGAIVRNGEVCLLVRGEDNVGRFAGTSRIGLAVSTDGVHFTLEPEPVLGPADDDCAQWEAVGGCEDPRVVEAPDGSYVCTYTGFEGTKPTLMVATSPDLRVWTKHGPAFADTPYAARSCKSGAIVTRAGPNGLVATRVDGRYWMYWGEGNIYAATSDDLVRWEPIVFDATGDRTLHLDDSGRWHVNRVAGAHVLRPLLAPRRAAFDSLIVEPGPPALLTDAGILLIYNGANHPEHGDPSLPPVAYSPAQALFDVRDPTVCIARSTEPFLRPELSEEATGQVNNVCFAQGLVAFGGQMRLYYGMADSRIGCAVAPMPAPGD